VKAALDEVAEYLARKSGYRVTAKQVEEFRKRLRNARRDDARARERTAEYLAAVQRAAASAKGIQARIDGTRDKKLRHALGAELAAYWRRQQKGELRIAATCFLRVKAA
jgi:hypothetical protein